ncbi:MBL fold metallo-hydrolase, partial [Gammaproteobacteria bacterium]|nr:MBL fold metallo-hydrolase [Gammaproteobacteria bacterium]
MTLHFVMTNSSNNYESESADMRYLLLLLSLLPMLAISDERPAHHLADGTFRNNYIGSIDKPFGDLMRWWREREQPEPIHYQLAPHHESVLSADPTPSTLTWIGHSTFLIQWQGFTILTDPHFGERASPVSFAGPKRYTPPGLTIAQLPPIDIVVISHNHYDHLDSGSIKKLSTLIGHDGQPPLFVVPLRLAEWMRDAGVERVIERDWWQFHDVGKLRMHAVPVQHWSARTLSDRNRTLWAGWVF